MEINLRIVCCQPSNVRPKELRYESPFLIRLWYLVGLWRGESVRADPVHIGFAFFSPLALCPPVYIGPTLYTREPRTYYSPYLIMVSRPYEYHGRFGYFDYFYRWHDVAHDVTLQGFLRQNLVCRKAGRLPMTSILCVLA